MAIDEGHDDIGSRSASLDELPRSPHEPPQGLIARMASSVKEKLGRLVSPSGKAGRKPGGEPQSADRAPVKPRTGPAPTTKKWRTNTSEKPPPWSWPMPNGTVAADTQSPERGNLLGGVGRLAAGALGAAAGAGCAIGKGLAKTVRGTAKLFQWFRKQLRAGTAGRPRRKPARVDERLLAKRHRETLRLLHMLETDPDRGLRYALSFGHGRNRGAPRQART